MGSPHEQAFSSARGWHRIEDDLVMDGETPKWEADLLKNEFDNFKDILGKWATFLSIVEERDNAEGESANGE